MTLQSLIVLAVCAAVGGFVGWFTSYLAMALARRPGGAFDSRMSMILVAIASGSVVGADAWLQFGAWAQGIACFAGCVAVALVLLPRNWALVSMQQLEMLLNQQSKGEFRWADGQRRSAHISYDTAHLCYRNKLYALSASAARDGMQTLLAPQLKYEPKAAPVKKKARPTVCPEEFKPHNRIAHLFD